LQFLSLVFLELPVHAQDIFTAKLGPYQQRFDKLGTGNATFSNGMNATTVPGIIAGYNYEGRFSGVPSPIAANEGKNSASAAYNFGTTEATDQAPGYIAGGLNGNSDIDYICVRLRDRSKTTIKNLDIRYAIEQWYNTSLASDVYLRASYQVYIDSISFATNDLVQTTGSAGWAAAPELDLQSPATGGILRKVDGNSTTYRRVAQHTLTNSNLPNTSEIVLRFTYVFNSQANGNGISLDDLAVYPKTNVLYSTTTGALDSKTNTWGQATDCSNPPAKEVNSTAANFTYYVRGTNAALRLKTGTWQVTGTNSRVIVGTSATPATLCVAPKDNIAATLDVVDGSTLNIATPLITPATTLKLGLLAAGSTVQHTATSTQNILSAVYSTLTIEGSSVKTLAGNVTVTQALSLAQAVQLTSDNLTLLRGATLMRKSGDKVVINGLGEYRATVIGTNSSALVFPVATSTGPTSYLPATLTAAASDKDEIYRVSVMDKVYTTYATSGAGPTATNSPRPMLMASTITVTSMWFINHNETGTPLSAMLKLAWTPAKERISFGQATSYIDHYAKAVAAWEGIASARGSFSDGNSPDGSFPDDGQLAVQRMAVTTFSPFAVTSTAPVPRPIELVSFWATHKGASVLCTWTTANEQQHNYFLVERRIEGTTFQAVDTMAGRNLGASPYTYYFRDEHPASGLLYYRLRQVDFDDTTTFSPVAAVRVAAPFEAPISVPPNPDTGLFKLRTAFAAATHLQGTVVNVIGKQVLVINEPLHYGLTNRQLCLSRQPAGLYVLRLTGGQATSVVRLLKH
jgi:hypothetical protein